MKNLVKKEKIEKKTDSETLVQEKNNNRLEKNTTYTKYRKFKTWITIGKTIDRIIKRNRKKNKKEI